MYPIILDLWGFQISSFGVMVALGFLVGGWMAGPSFERVGMTRDDAWRIVFWAVIGGMVGAKLWNVAESLARPGELNGSIIMLLRGGFTWYGGLLGGVVASVSAAYLGGLSIRKVVDAAAPSLAIGQAIGRVGCFLVGDDYGKVTDVPWAFAFPEGQPPTTDPVHPTMLYETLWLVPVGLLLWRRRGRSPFLFGEYLMLAGLGRLCIEVLRTNPGLIGPLSNAQVTALACMVAGGLSWLYFKGRPMEGQTAT